MREIAKILTYFFFSCGQLHAFEHVEDPLPDFTLEIVGIERVSSKTIIVSTRIENSTVEPVCVGTIDDAASVFYIPFEISGTLEIDDADEHDSDNILPDRFGKLLVEPDQQLLVESEILESSLDLYIDITGSFIGRYRNGDPFRVRMGVTYHNCSDRDEEVFGFTYSELSEILRFGEN